MSGLVSENLWSTYTGSCLTGKLLSLMFLHDGYSGSQFYKSVEIVSS